MHAGAMMQTPRHHRSQFPAWLAAALAILLVAGCARSLSRVQRVPGEPATIAELWQEPANVQQRDLFYGPGGKELMPRERTFTFVAEDTSGWSPGFDVRDSAGVEWSVKLGPEAQTEVVTSRVLWAVGFHQPPTYYLEDWSLSGQMNGPQEPGRFRPSLEGQEVIGDWSFYENPFVGTREFGGLIVTNLIVNNWDWKTSNNKIYEFSTPQNGVRRMFVVRDVGASFGKYSYPTLLKWFRLRGFGQGTRNDLAGFEQQGFIERVEGDEVDFDYRGIYRDVIDSVTPEDVTWACSRLSRLTDDQWNDAFRAGGYTPEETARFVAKIKAKIDEGLELTGR
jgi:hypothetical protein